MAAWRPPEDEEVAWVLEVVGCQRSHLGDMSEDEFRYIYSNEYHVVLVGDSRDPFVFRFSPASGHFHCTTKVGAGRLAYRVALSATGAN